MAPSEARSQSRRRQRGRLNDLNSPTADVSYTDAENASMPPTRAGLACEACRIRKTRCVGFPICNWCQHRNQACVRGSNAPTNPLDAWGEQILEAVNQAKFEILAATSTPTYVRDRASRDSTDLGPGANIRAQQLEHQAQDSTGPFRLSSADDILTWEVFRPIAHALPNHDAQAPQYHEADRPLRAQAGADTSLPCLRRLQQRFELKFAASQPLVSSVRLERYIRDVAESGGIWTAESCLVFLVCALASACDCNTDHSDSMGPPSVPSSFTSMASSNPSAPVLHEQAHRYWTMAKRRLAWGLDCLDPLLTAQCTILAGLWYLQNGAPTMAKRMFTHAVQEAVEVSGAGFAGDESMFASSISKTCTQLLQRLSAELGSASSIQEAVLTQVLQINSAVYPRADPFGATRSEILNLLAITPTQLQATGVHILLRHVRALHSRITPPGHAGYDTMSWTQDILQTELKSMLLRVCLKSYLIPNLIQTLSPDQMETNMADSSPELDELLVLAQQGIDSTALLLRSHLASSHLGSSANHHDAMGITASPNPTPKSRTGGCREHTEAWFQNRAAYTGCLLLHAVAYARRRAAASETAYMHCLEISLPPNWQMLADSTTALLLAQSTGSDLWHCGRKLNAIAPLCGVGAGMGNVQAG